MNTPEERVSRLREISRRMRIDILEMLAESGSGHPGGSLSAIDVLAFLSVGLLCLPLVSSSA